MINYFKTHKKISLAILLGLIFLASFSVHYFIYLSKGFVITEYFNLVVARNWAQTGEISYENSQNVILSSDLIKSNGEFADLGNKLIFLLYGLLFKIFGFQPALPIYVTFILYSLAVVFLFLVARRIFDAKIGFIAAIFSIAAPFFLPASNTVGHHEWAYLFLVLAAFFYFYPRQEKNTRLILTGIFLGLMLAAKNSFFVAIPPFLILEFWQARDDLKRAFLKSGLIAVFTILVATPFVFYGGNAYLSTLSQNQHEYQPSAIFNDFYPDPYTFNHEKYDFLKNLTENQGGSVAGNFYFWGKLGSAFRSNSIWYGWLVPMIFSAWIYFKGLFLSFSIFGGFLTWFFISLAFVYLNKLKNNALILFCVSFLAFWLSGLVLLKTSNYSHFLILTLPASLLLGLGVCKLANMVSQMIRLSRISARKVFVFTVAVFFIFYLQISWSAIGELYQNSNFTKEIFAFARDAKNQKYFSQPSAKNEVIAVGWASEVPAMLNYYLNDNFVRFAPETITKLAGQGKLSEAFKTYKITGFVGYDLAAAELINRAADNRLKNYSELLK